MTDRTYGGYTLDEAFAEWNDNGPSQPVVHALIARVRELEAENAALRAERDARVVLPEIPPNHCCEVIHHADTGEHCATMWDVSEGQRRVERRYGPTPAAALEELRKKMETKK